MDADKVKRDASGKWVGLLHQLGVEVPDSPKKHTGCPICGPGRNSHRFRFDNRDGGGNWICTQCGAGDSFSLIQKCRNVDFPTALKMVADLTGTKQDKPAKTKQADPRISLNKLWQASVPLTGSDPVSKYLHSRGINLTPSNVRYCEKCYNSDTKTELPSMIARIHNKAGKPVCLHRTYLADVKNRKKNMPGVALAEVAIRLTMPEDSMFEDGTLGVAEGIETALSVSQIFGVACWALISTAIMIGFEPPEEYRKIIIYADNDFNYSGAKAAYTLANKLYLKDFIVSVEMPSKAGYDFNDILT